MCNTNQKKIWTNVDVDIFENPIVIQKQALIKSIKISTYLKDKSTGLIGNETYDLCTLPEEYRPATTVILNTVCGRESNGITSTPDYVFIQISTNGLVSMVPFNNLTIHALNLTLAYF